MVQQQLPEPLPTVLGSAAIALWMLTPGTITIGKGGGSYNWHEVMPPRLRPELLAILRQRVETGSRSRLTIRAADQSLIAERHHAVLILLLVVCPAGRDEGEVTRLRGGDALYAMAAPNDVAESVTLQRMG